jgi:hypothetical protein
MGDRGTDFLERYFPSEEEGLNQMKATEVNFLKFLKQPNQFVQGIIWGLRSPP